MANDEPTLDPATQAAFALGTAVRYNADAPAKDAGMLANAAAEQTVNGQQPKAAIDFLKENNAEYLRNRDTLIIKEEGVINYPYVDSVGIATQGVGINLRDDGHLDRLLSDAGLSKDKLAETMVGPFKPGADGSDPRQALAAREYADIRSTVGAVANESFPHKDAKGRDVGASHGNAAEIAIDATMTQLHAKDPRVPATLTYPPDTPLINTLSHTLDGYDQQDHPAPGAKTPAHNPDEQAKLQSDAKGLGIGDLTAGQRDALREIIHKAARSSDRMAAINAKMDEFHERNASIPAAITGSSVAKMTAALDDTANKDHEHRVDKWLAGVPESREREALASLAYNGRVGIGKDKKGNPAIANAAMRNDMIEGERAKAFMEVALHNNGKKSRTAGIGERRLDEAETLGWAKDPKAPTAEEARQFEAALAVYRGDLDRNLSEFSHPKPSMSVNAQKTSIRYANDLSATFAAEDAKAKGVIKTLEQQELQIERTPGPFDDKALAAIVGPANVNEATKDLSTILGDSRFTHVDTYPMALTASPVPQTQTGPAKDASPVK